LSLCQSLGSSAETAGGGCCQELMALGHRSGWILVEGDVESRQPSHVVHLRMFRDLRTGELVDTPVPLLLNGRIDALVKIPNDAVSVPLALAGASHGQQPLLRARSVGAFERLWRMLYRIIGAYTVLSDDERLRAGLTLRRAVFDLQGTYRAATECRLQYPPLAYADWIVSFDVPSDEDKRRISAHIARLAARPRFHILLYSRGGEEQGVRATLASLQGQLYRDFDCVVLDDIGRDAAVVPRPAEGDWVLRLRAGDTLPAHALYWFACAVVDRPDVAIVYADDDALDTSGQRYAPRFKPDWSLTHLRSTNYVGDAVAVRGDALKAVGGLGAEDCRRGLYDKLLQVIDHEDRPVVHVPAVLLHRGPRGLADSAMLEAADWETAALRRHLSRHGVAAQVMPTLPGCRRVRHRLPDFPPLVSIIVPTRDAENLLRRCIDSVLGKTTYPRFEILVVDNQSAHPRALAYLREAAAHPAIRVLPFDRPFNYSAINNFAARAARGEVLCLLNNDTEVISQDWLDEMVGHLLQTRVGVVGAKLYYPDGRVQHGGVAVGAGGAADHLHSLMPRDDPGYCNRAAVAGDLSAVTAACMVTWRDLYLELGGLDARWFKVALNDVDYCLRVRAAGWKVIWTPHAELYHLESVSRGRPRTWRERWRAKLEVLILRRRWPQAMRVDPFYSPNLNYRQPDFTPGRSLRVRKPWL